MLAGDVCFLMLTQLYQIVEFAIHEQKWFRIYEYEYIGIFSLDLYLKYHWNMHTFNEFIILVKSNSSGKSNIHVPTT